MKTGTLTLSALLLAAGTLFASLPAEAGHDRRDFREWRHDHRHVGPGYGHKRHHAAPHRHSQRVVTRHVVRERYVYPPAISHRHVYPAYPVYPAPVYYPYRRDPAIVIGVSIPPLVIPLR